MSIIPTSSRPITPQNYTIRTLTTLLRPVPNVATPSRHLLSTSLSLSSHASTSTKRPGIRGSRRRDRGPGALGSRRRVIWMNSRRILETTMTGITIRGNLARMVSGVRAWCSGVKMIPPACGGVFCTKEPGRLRCFLLPLLLACQHFGISLSLHGGSFPR